MSTRTSKGIATDIDKAVGRAIRARRIMIGMSQQQMADKIGITFQQAHKYERGVNRVSAGRLYDIASALGVEVSVLFEQVNPTCAVASPNSRQLLEVARNMMRIGDHKLRAALAEAIRAAAESCAAS